MVLASGTVSGTDDIVLTLTDDVPSTGSLHVVVGTFSNFPPAPDISQQFTSVTDSESHSWIWTHTQSASAPLIHVQRETVGSGASTKSVYVASAGRPCSAGDLIAGDTVSVNWNSFYPTQLTLIAVLIYLSAEFVLPYASPAAVLGTSWPEDDIVNTSTTVGWQFTDSRHTEGARYLAAFVSHPAGSFTPSEGSLVTEVVGTNHSLAVVASPNYEAEESGNPGGSWASARTLYVANYKWFSSLEVSEGVCLDRIRWRAFDQDEV